MKVNEMIDVIERQRDELTMLQLIPVSLTKDGIQATADALAQYILEQGDQPPLMMWVKLRSLKDVIDGAIKGIEADAMAQAELWDEGNGRGAIVLGAKVGVTNGAAKYEYSHDGAWSDLDAAIKVLSQKKKDREAFLKSLEQELVDPQTGELISPAIQLSLGNRSISLTIPKK